MELALNLVWLAACVVVLGTTLGALRRGALRVSPGIALTAGFAVCLLLLPVISMSDDLLQARQGGLPLAAQTWHLASEGAAAALEVNLLAGSFLLALLWLGLTMTVQVEPERHVRRHSAWLTRSQRLRPPPTSAL